MWDYEERRSREHRYRIMFRGAIVFLLISIPLGMFGVLTAVFHAEMGPLMLSVLLADVSLLLGYKVISSTVRILELDAEAMGAGPGLNGGGDIGTGGAGMRNEDA